MTSNNGRHNHVKVIVEFIKIFISIYSCLYCTDIGTGSTDGSHGTGDVPNNIYIA